MNAPLAKEQIAALMPHNLTYRMSPVESTERALADARSPTLRARLGTMLAAIAALPRRRAVIDELSMLSDRELADIGLSRAEVGRVFDPRFAAHR